MVLKHDATRGETRDYVYSDWPSSSHNLYTVYSGGNHKIIAQHNASSDPWNDERIEATLWPERQQEIIQSILDALIYACFGAMIVLAYLT